MNPSTILSFDIEEHHRIEAAVHLTCSDELKAVYAQRMEHTTRKLLKILAEFETLASFYIVGEIARTHPQLVREIHAAGHEIGSHSWDHQRVHRFNRESFKHDLLKSKHALEDVTGCEVKGFRAPTFSIVRETAFALDVLRECGFAYDSSIFPVRHDRYGIPDAPRTPFIARTATGELLELPPVTLHRFGANLPVGGGGYFRLFPPSVLRAGIDEVLGLNPGVAMLYFHPWEFDPAQPRLPLNRLSKFRTYIGMGGSTSRLRSLLHRGGFQRAIDVVEKLQVQKLERFPI